MYVKFLCVCTVCMYVGRTKHYDVYITPGRAQEDAQPGLVKAKSASQGISVMDDAEDDDDERFGRLLVCMYVCICIYVCM